MARNPKVKIRQDGALPEGPITKPAKGRDMTPKQEGALPDGPNTTPAPGQDMTPKQDGALPAPPPKTKRYKTKEVTPEKPGGDS